MRLNDGSRIRQLHPVCVCHSAYRSYSKQNVVSASGRMTSEVFVEEAMPFNGNKKCIQSKQLFSISISRHKHGKIIELDLNWLKQMSCSNPIHTHGKLNIKCLCIYSSYSFMFIWGLVGMNKKDSDRRLLQETHSILMKSIVASMLLQMENKLQIATIQDYEKYEIQSRVVRLCIPFSCPCSFRP